MKRNRLWLTLLPGLWMSAAALAAGSLPYLGDLTLRDGSRLTKVQVLKVEPDGLRVEHANGIGKLALETLPPETVKQFSLTESAAADWRAAEKKRRDAADAVERELAVKKIIEASRADQDNKVRQQRLALYERMRAGTLNYVDADTALRQSIALHREAGRDDLAALLEEDREVLKQQEVYRPAADLEAKKQELANRVAQLESDLASARSQPPTIVYTEPSPVWIPSTTIYYNPGPVYTPAPLNPPPYCPPSTGTGRPPWMGPGALRPPAGNFPSGVIQPRGGFPPVTQTLPPAMGPRQPGVRQPQTPPISVRQPQTPPISIPGARSAPVYRPAGPPPVTNLPVARPAPSYGPSRSFPYPGNGNGGGGGGGGNGRNMPRR